MADETLDVKGGASTTYTALHLKTPLHRFKGHVLVDMDLPLHRFSFVKPSHNDDHYSACMIKQLGHKIEENDRKI